MKRCIFSLLAVLIMVGAGPVQSAVILDGGYITAVEGFVYDGKVYDVEFKNGNFNTVFGSTTPEFWNDATTDHKAVGLALSQAFNDAGHGGTIIKDGSSASSMFYLPIREGGSNTLYDTEAFYNDTTPWKWKLTGSDYDKGSVLGMFAVFMPVAPQVANLTIIKEADPEDGTDFDFTINGPTTWTDYAPSGTWRFVRILTESNGKSYFSFADSSYNHYLYELDGTTWTDITPSGMWEDILFVTETGGKSYFSFRDSSWDFHLHEFDGTTVTDITPPGTWDGFYFLTESDGKAYFNFDSANAYLYELDGTTWTNITPSSTWLWMEFLSESGGKAYLSFADSSYNYYMYEFDGTTLNDITPTGTWKYIYFLTESNGKSYFSFRDSSYNHYLYELDGTTFTDLSPSGTWKGIDFLTEISGKSYYHFKDSSFNHQVYELDGATLTDISPSGTWNDISFLTESNGKFYFSFKDSSYSPYLYGFDGATWTDITPSGTWYSMFFLTESGGKSYFSFEDSSYNNHVYELDGTTLTDITPSGTWEDILFMTKSGGKVYFSFRDSTYNHYLYELDGTTLTDISPPGTWNAIDFKTESNGKSYFSFVDSSHNTYLMALTVPSTFTLDNAAPDDGDSVYQSITLNALPVGSYDITEMLPANWNLDYVSCTGASETATFMDETLSVTLNEGEDVVCTFTNTKDEGVCSTLGDNSAPWALDTDIFTFDGEAGDEVTITLNADKSGSYTGKRASLILWDKIHGAFLFKINRGKLPNSISATLTANGKYKVLVNEQSKYARGKKFKGDYCLDLDSPNGAILNPTSWVE